MRYVLIVDRVLIVDVRIYIYDASASTCLSSSYVRYVLTVDRVLIVDVRIYMMYQLARAYQAAMCATS